MNKIKFSILFDVIVKTHSKKLKNKYNIKNSENNKAVITAEYNSFLSLKLCVYSW